MVYNIYHIVKPPRKKIYTIYIFKGLLEVFHRSFNGKYTLSSDVFKLTIVLIS